MHGFHTPREPSAQSGSSTYASAQTHHAEPHGGDGSPANPFGALWTLGYRRLVPIVPPDAAISPRSTLFKRLGTAKDGRGKAPGVRGADGEWRGFDWVRHETEPADVERWHAMGAGVGIKTGGGIVAIDVDTLDEALADTIAEVTERRFGHLPVRFGREPKHLYLLAVRDEVPYMRIEFGEPAERVEILSEGRQFVALGIHPKTGKPYDWRSGLPKRDALPLVGRADIEAYLEELRRILPAARPVHKEGAGAERAVDQRALAGLLEHVRKAVRAIPNKGDEFADREAYIRVGAAIKAALPDHPAEAFELFAEWCEGWQDPPTGEDGRPGGNDPDTVRADWARLKPPFSIGAAYLYDLAERHGDGSFNRVEVWFDEIVETEANPFDIAQAREAGAAKLDAAPFDFGAATRLAPGWSAEIRPKEFTLGTRFQPGVLTLGIGAPGVSKSTFAMLSALAIASGKALTGEHVSRTGRVLIYAGEESLDELHRRLAAAVRFHRIDPALVADRVRLLSGPDQRRLVFAERRERNGVIRPGADLPALADFIRREGIIHAVLDPQISLQNGIAENESTDMEALGDQIRVFARETGISIDLIHHARKGGADVESQAGVADAARGSNAIVALVRSAYTLVPMGAKTAEEINVSRERAARLVRLDDAKRNNTRRAPAERWFEIVSVLPDTGAVVPDAQFDSKSPAAFRLALESVGVHTPFDARAARHVARGERALAEEGRRHEERVWLLARMSADVLDRTDATRLFRGWRGVGETAARTALDAIVPIGAGAAVDVTMPDGSSWRLWRDQRPSRSGLKWVILRERIGQDVREAPAESDAGVFE